MPNWCPGRRRVVMFLDVRGHLTGGQPPSVTSDNTIVSTLPRRRCRFVASRINGGFPSACDLDSHWRNVLASTLLDLVPVHASWRTRPSRGYRDQMMSLSIRRHARPYFGALPTPPRQPLLRWIQPLTSNSGPSPNIATEHNRSDVLALADSCARTSPTRTE